MNADRSMKRREDNVTGGQSIEYYFYELKPDFTFDSVGAETPLEYVGLSKGTQVDAAIYTKVLDNDMIKGQQTYQEFHDVTNTDQFNWQDWESFCGRNSLNSALKGNNYLFPLWHPSLKSCG